MRDDSRSAFATPQWHSTADAFLQARGLSMFVMDLTADECLYGSGRCGYCHVSLESLEPRPSECYARLPKTRDAVTCVTCRAGLSNCLAPVVLDGRAIAHAVVSGFVSSTRERRKLYEHLIGRDVREEVARLAVRSMPIVTRREIEGFARLAASLAESAAVVQSASEGSRLDTGHGLAAENGDAVMIAAMDVTRALSDPAETATRLLANALALFRASAASIALSRTDGLVEVLASAGDGMPPRGARLRLDGRAASKAISSTRTVIVADDAGVRPGRGCTLVTPLVVGSTTTGVFDLRLSRGEALDASVVRRVERFARFAALAIAHASLFASVRAGNSAVSATEDPAIATAARDSNQSGIRA